MRLFFIFILLFVKKVLYTIKKNEFIIYFHFTFWEESFIQNKKKIQLVLHKKLWKNDKIPTTMIQTLTAEVLHRHAEHLPLST